MKKTIIMLLMVLLMIGSFVPISKADNPVIKDQFSADPAAIVHDGKAYLYTGHDEAAINGDFFVLKKWSIYSSSDLSKWKLEGYMPRTEFEWATGESAWASQAIERDGKFYWYVTVDNSDQNAPGFALGVAVSDNPAGGFKDAIGGPLVISTDTENPENMGSDSWDDIDPTVYIDDDGQAYLYWGNTHLYYAKLKENMIELDGHIHKVDIENMPGTFTEAPFLHKYEGKYYLTYAMNYPEELVYAMSDSPTGPWEYKGKLMDTLDGSGTSHQAVLQFEDEWYFIYHTAALPTGGNYRRSVAIEKLNYNHDGTIQKITPTASGISDSSFSLKSYHDQNRYVRHLNGDLRVDPVDNNSLDSRWHTVDGLANNGEDFISFQSENKPGFYLVRNGSDIELKKHDGTDSFKEAATFKKVPGLADKNWVSFQALNDEDLYLYQRDNFTFGVNTVASAEQNGRATFELAEADVTEVVLDKTSLTLEEGTSSTIHAKVTPNTALNKKVSFYSSNSDVVTISESTYDAKTGETSITLKGKTAGSTEIIAVSEDGNYSAKTTVEIKKHEENPIEIKDVVISSHSKSKEINIEGILKNQSGRDVTVKVEDPNGNFAYLDQTTTNDHGSFAFDFKLNDEVNGVFQVSIGAADLEKVYKSSFTYTVDAPDSGDKDGPGKGNGDSPNKDKENPGDKAESPTDKHDDSKNKDGKGLPSTATSMFNYLVIGALLIVGGVVTIFMRKRKIQE